MSANDEKQYRSLLQEIEKHSPKASLWLEQIYKNYGTQAGCHASVAIVWLHARVELYGERAFTDFSEKEVQSFTFFEEMREQPDALALFRNMLQTYLIEQRADSGEHIPGEWIDNLAANNAHTLEEDDRRF